MAADSQPAIELPGTPTVLSGKSIDDEFGDGLVSAPTSSPRLATTEGPGHNAPIQVNQLCDIRGCVTTDLGEPVNRFRIEAIRPEEEVSLFHGVGSSLSRECEDPEGHFCLEGMAEGEWILTAHGAGDTRSSPAVCSVTRDGTDLSLVLPRPAGISGRVVSAAGTSVPGSFVYIWYAGEENPAYTSFGAPEPRGQTDDRGRFRLDKVQPGTFKVMASHSAHCDSEWIEVSVGPGDTHEVTIALRDGGVVTGVVHSTLGEVANRQVDLFSFRGTIGWRNAKTDGGGRFTMSGVIPQDYIIELRAPGYPNLSPQDAQSYTGIRKRITVVAGETTEADFGGEKRSIRVTGVVTSSGQLLSGLKVSALSLSGGEDRGEMATTDQMGAYELTVYEVGEHRFTITANYGSYVTFERSIPDRDATEMSFEVPSGIIAGRVLAPDGSPLPGVGVTVLRHKASNQHDSATFWDDYRRKKTDEKGAFEFSLLAPGSYTVRAVDGFQGDSPAPRVPYGRAVIPSVEVIDSTRVEGMDIRLLPEGCISGTVVDSTGTPVPDAWIKVYDSTGLSLSGTWETRTDVTGHLLVRSVAPGIYKVVARKGEREATSPEVRVVADETSSVQVVLL